MTASLSDSDRRPVLVLGIGNLLLRDDGVGLELLRRLEERCGGDGRFEFVDGGTQGIALLPYLAGRSAVLILDAVQLGASPGAVHVVTELSRITGRCGTTSHEGNAGELMAAASLVGDLPPHVVVVGVEPGEVCTGIGLTSAVSAGVEEAAARARQELGALIERAASAASC